MKELTVPKDVYGPIQTKGHGAYEDYLYKELEDTGFDMQTPILTTWNRSSGSLRYIQKTQAEALGYDTDEVVTQSGIILKNKKIIQ